MERAADTAWAESRRTIRQERFCVEGSLAPVACLECGAEPCSRQDTCKTIAMWKKFYDLVNGYFDHITVADLVYGNLNTEDFQF